MDDDETTGQIGPPPARGAATPRKPYTAPRLIRYGPVWDRTRADGGGSVLPTGDT